MTNGEKFKEVFKISQVDEGELYAYVWLPNHDAAEISIEWWNAEYQEPTTKNDLGVDCISRAEVLKIFDEWFATCDIADKKDSPKIKIKALPSITPQPRKGHWIYDYTSADGHRIYHCSECGCYLQPKHSEPLDSFKWCSLCGADMREVKDE